MFRDFWNNDFVIFGLHGIHEDGTCECGNPDCQAVGKHPITKQWQYTEHFSEDQLEEMEQDGLFDSGYGILIQNGLLVVDVDARNGGVESYARLIEQIPEIAGAGLIVETGSGNGSKHLFFKYSNTSQALSTKLNNYPGIDFKHSGFVVGAGSNHKSGNKYKVLLGSPEDIGDAPKALLELLTRPRVVAISTDSDMGLDDYIKAVNHIPSDCDYDTWVTVGMAIHHATSGSDEGLVVFDTWSAKGGEKYKGITEIDEKWHSFGKDNDRPVTAGTLIFIAKKYGYEKTFEKIEIPWERSEIIPGVVKPILQWDYSHVDIKRPPGFVGELTEYINSQCIYPRENLATMAALYVTGCMLSMRYQFQGSALNLYCFGVAASSSGKESIFKCVMDILKKAGLISAAYGSIKSEQEIIRNLITHQASYYVMDEVALLFKKIKNSSKGGSSYLEGIPRQLLQIYSKGCGLLPIGGDDKAIFKDKIDKRIKDLIKMEDKGEDHKDAIKELVKRKQEIDSGIVNPFLSMFGLSTFSEFDSIVSYDSVVNGFVGRCLIQQEKNDNPRPRKGVTYATIPKIHQGLLGKIMTMYYGGTTTEKRIQQDGERAEVPCSKDATEMLESFKEYVFDLADHHGISGEGYQEVTRRSIELLNKLVGIMGAADGEITTNHVLFASKYIAKDMEEKVRLVAASEKNGFEALCSRVMGYIDQDRWQYQSYICNKLKKKYKPEDVIKCINYLESNGTIVRNDLLLQKK